MCFKNKLSEIYINNFANYNLFWLNDNIASGIIWNNVQLDILSQYDFFEFEFLPELRVDELQFALLFQGI